MQINQIGGEFALIDRLRRLVPSRCRELIVGIGDDAAVLKTADEGRYQLVTTDLLVENQHFNFSWGGPEEAGFKAVEANVSDIAAMGGEPTVMLVSLALPRQTPVETVEALYRGMGRACRRNGVTVAGGDTTRGGAITISITLLGSVAVERLCLRSQARVGDLIGITGPLGASAAGLALFQRKLAATPYLRRKHLVPECRLDAAPLLAPLVNAMIDVSDGLAPEVGHICSQSGVGARIFAAEIPLHPDVTAAAAALDRDPLTFALGGGEDYELLFTIAPCRLEGLRRTGLAITVVGAITSAADGRLLVGADGAARALQGGYNHFA
jgi:thiamine-monophosphate kinase